jgi:CheY-like chemotaxis protein/ketosteroid isomerase-like protein
VTQPPKLLLIEGTPAQAQPTVELLEDHGFEVDWLRTVHEGRERLASLPYRLVLTDYLTADVAEAEPQMRQLLDAAGPVPVVCVSAWRFFRSSLTDRFAFVLYKPFVPEELLAIVGTLLTIEERPHEVAQITRYFEALTRCDWSALGALCTDDVEYRAPQASSHAAHVVVGRSNFESMAARTFASFPGARFEVVEVTPLPQGAVARYRGSWQLPDHSEAALEASVTFRFAAGQIAGIGVRLDADKVRAMTEARP